MTVVRFYLFSYGNVLILGELVSVWQVSSNIETLYGVTLHSLWREAPQAGWQLKRCQNGPWNWSDSLGSFPDRATKAESPSQMKGSWAAKKTLKRANLIPAVWKTFRPTEAPGKDILQPVEPSTGCAVSPGAQLFELSPMLCGLRWHSCLSHSCSCK